MRITMPATQVSSSVTSNGLRVIWAILKNELLLNMARPLASMVTITVPLNFLILFVLFALGGGHAPVGVFQVDHGPYSVAMVQALNRALTFDIQAVPSQDAGAELISRHRSVATITIPSGFSQAIAQKRRIALPVTIYNLNEDFADDIRRGLPLAVLKFYQQNVPSALSLNWQEVDAYSGNVSFLGYLAVSIQTVALLIGGLLFGGRGIAGEQERGTIKELLLAPVPAWSVIVGKLAAGLVNGIISSVLVLLMLLAFGLHPVSWGELLGVALLSLLVFVSLGVAIGSLVRRQALVAPFAFALGLPLFFISGAFGPISWSTTASADIARVFPVAYANVAFQHAFHGYWPIDVTPLVLWAILGIWAVGAIGLGVLAYQRSTAAH